MVRFFIPLVSVSFITGCLIAHNFSPQTVYVIVIVGVITLGMGIVRRSAVAVLCCVAILALCFGMLRVIHTEQQESAVWAHLYATKVHLEGMVTGDIEERKTRSRYVVDIHTITTRSGEVMYPDGAVLVYEQYPTTCQVGEEVSFEAYLQEPEDFITETNRIFRYRRYLQQLGIHAITFIDGSGCTGKVKSIDVFATLRKHFMAAAHSVLPVQEASLLGGLLLGIRGLLSDELLEKFRVTGLIHIIVLSGYNITLVAEAVRRLCSRAPRMTALIISLTVIILFVLLAGSQTAAVRAGSMASIALVARALHREHDGIRILLLVGAGMVLYDPGNILFSTSFHMSFLATLGLLLFSPILERRLTWVTERLQVRNIVAATFATQVFLLPYLAYSIGEVSVVGIVANILVLPLVPIAMAFGAALILVALIIPGIAVGLAPLAYLPLASIIWITNLLAIPYAAVPLLEIPAAVLLLSIAFLTYLGITIQNWDTQRDRQQHPKKPP